MIDHVWTVLCSRVVIDKTTNNVSIQEAIERITVPGEPDPKVAIQFPMQLVTLWVRSQPDQPARSQARLTFLSPSGEQLIEVDLPLDLTEHERLRTPAQIGALPAPEAGRYYFYLDLQIEGENDWKRVAAIPLTIRFDPDAERDLMPVREKALGSPEAATDDLLDET